MPSSRLLGMKRRPCRLRATTTQPENASALVCIVSIMRGPFYNGAVGDALLENKRAFCSACGYACLWYNDTYRERCAGRRSPAWERLPALFDALFVRRPPCRVAMWVDADALFYAPVGLPALRSPISFARDWMGLNAGVMILTRSRATQTLLRIAWNQTQFGNLSLGAEQSALRFALVVVRPELQQHATLYENLVRYVPQFFTPRAAKRHNVTDRPPLYHAAGCTAARAQPPSPIWSPAAHAHARRATLEHPRLQRYRVVPRVASPEP